MRTTSREHERTRFRAERDAACIELYLCELALHDAHQSGVDAWVRAASDHLHRALMRHRRAEAVLAHLAAGAA
jgi:hypothetical protein